MTTALVPIIRELRGNVCRCGARKMERQSFCSACYRKLPEDIQRGLRKHISAGYADEYRRACGVLGLPMPEVAN